MALGTGLNKSNMVDATESGHSPTNIVGPRTDGEFPGVGSVYSATLNERTNKANTRNLGPSRDPGVIGGAQLPAVTMSQRKTGGVGSVTISRRGE